MINLYPLLVSHINHAETFEVDGQTFPFPGVWRTELRFRKTPTEETWAFLLAPRLAKMFRSGRVTSILFEHEGQRFVFDLLVLSERLDIRTAEYVVIGKIIEST